MESIESLKSLSIPSKSKAYESYENNEESEMKKFRESFESNKKTIEILCLSGNSYSKNFCFKFADSLSEATNLQIVNFNDIYVSRKKDELSESVEYLSKSLIGKNILRLDISNNALGPSGSQALSSFLLQAKNLQTLLINNCGLGIDGVTIISESLEKGTPNLEVWAMARNRAENPGAIKIGQALKTLKKIKEIHLFQNVIRKEGMIALLNGLQNCEDLEVLDICDNFIKDEAAEELAKVILQCKKIKSLNLSDCNMEKIENNILINALEKSDLKLEKIGYGYNELNEELAKRLIDTLLSKNKNLKRLDIKGNEFKKSTKNYYKTKLSEFSLEKIVSAYESDDEAEEDELVKNFNDLKI